MEQKPPIDHVLNSLDGLQKADPGPFFYTRVRARLQKEETGVWGKTILFLTRPAVALATLGLIIALNTAAFLYQRNDASNDTTEQVNAEDFNTTVAANSYYNENPDAR